MACLQVDAEVLALGSHAANDPPGASSGDASLSTPPKTQDVVHNLETLDDLFAVTAATSCHGEERPQKRRKLEGDRLIEAQPVHFADNRSVVLAKVSIILNPAPSLATTRPTPPVSDTAKPIVLCLDNFSELDASNSRIVLFDIATNSSIEILATLKASALQSIRAHVKAAATLAYNTQRRKARARPRAAFSRCLLAPPTAASHSHKLEIEIRWLLGISVIEDPSVSAHHMKEDLRLLSTYLRGATAHSDTLWQLSDFYDSVHVPPTDLHVSPQIQHKLVDTTLYPFQQRAIDWLLRREGVAYSEAGLLVPFVEDVTPASFRAAQDANGTACYVSGLRGMVVADLEAAKGDALQSLKGGILAEEMGLGKTVELIALISHHKRPSLDGKVFDANAGAHVRPSGATLIITPPSILEQWRSEIHAHAPDLKVFHYKGLPPSSASKKEHATATVEKLVRWKTDARETILNRIKMGHVMAYAGNVKNRAETALPFYVGALEDTKAYVSLCRQELEQEQNRLGVSVALKRDEDSDAEEGLEKDNLGSISSMRRALRSFLELEHMCKFFIATTHHQMKDHLDAQQADAETSLREEQLETEWYEQAKAVRRELLGEVKITTQRQMRRIETRKPFHQLPVVNELPDLGGIESRRILETIDEISDFMNAQAAKIQEWRTKIVDILLMRLTDDDDDLETTGDEYEASLKAQDELYVSIMALRTLVADRSLVVHGLRDLLIEEELKTAERKARNTDPEVDNGHAPELLLEFAKQRQELMSTLHGSSLKGVIAEIRSKITPLQWRAENDDNRAATESTVLHKHLSSVQVIMTQQSKALVEMEKEQELFRSTMNQRLEYYRQFQHISDTVASYKAELDEKFDQATFQVFDYRRGKSLESVNVLKAKHAYLLNLRAEDQKSVAADCIICQEAIEVGVLTTCGHKQKLKSSDFKDISLKPSEIAAKTDSPAEEASPQASTPNPKDMAIYSDLSDTTLREIKMIDLPGSYGSKIDMIAKHLLWIRANDPGAKSVIFSQYRDFLDVLATAFSAWKIGASSIRDKNGIARFKQHAATEVFLLDAKSDSSGLNLVNATYVFLCEPLINPALELQAIARVHRIGQQRPTAVFMYLVANTVEEAIYDISVARRLQHMRSADITSTSTSSPPVANPTPLDPTPFPPAAQDQDQGQEHQQQQQQENNQETTLDNANSAELQSAPLKQLLSKGGAGEAVRNDDLW
ncbi:hypothetical protein N0V95_008896, partial [Ascochyta clinopodiicola]